MRIVVYLQFLTALPRLQRESRKCGQELYRYRYTILGIRRRLITYSYYLVN